MGCGCKNKGNNVQPQNQTNNVKIKITENTGNIPLTTKQDQQVDVILNKIKELKTKQ
jgi:hypothetical protein